MTTTIDLAEMALALSEGFGARYDASHVGGRSAMATALSARFDLSSAEATEMLDALERADAIRWIPQPGAEWINSRHGLDIELGYWKLERSLR